MKPAFFGGERALDKGDNKRDGDGASGKDPRRVGAQTRSARSARPGVAPLGDALRGVYEVTVSETVPQEMLDLLGKLD